MYCANTETSIPDIMNITSKKYVIKTLDIKADKLPLRIAVSITNYIEKHNIILVSNLIDVIKLKSDDMVCIIGKQ